MTAPRPVDPVPFQLEGLRAELADLAYDLERRGQVDAADVAMMVRARLREISVPEGAEQTDEASLICLSLPP
jgi:hypothetical protein